MATANRSKAVKCSSIGSVLIAILILASLSALASFCLSQTTNNTSVPPSMEWNKTYLQSPRSSASHVLQTSDGGFLMAGRTGSKYWPYEVQLVKTDASGEIQWQQDFNFLSNAAGLVQASDGGYVIAGDSYNASEGGPMTYPAPRGVMLVKTDQNGTMQWNQTLTGPSDGSASMIQTSDGGFAFAGASAQMWLVKIGSSGIVQWNQTYPKSPPDPIWVANSLIETSDGGFALAGDYFIPSTEGLYVLIKTEPALPPPPTPSPIPTPGPSPTPTSVLLGIDYTWLAVAAVVVVLIAVVAGVLLRRHRKQP